MALEIIFENINILTPIILGIGAALGIYLGIFMSKPRKHQIMKILPSDNRGYQFNVIRENAFSLFCKGFEGLPDQRFIKSEPAITIKIKKILGKSQQITRYLAREGTAYVQRADNTKKDVPLHQVIRTMLTEEYYQKMPEEYREIIENGKVGITVGLVKTALTPVDKNNQPMRTISEEDIKREEDKQAAETFWDGKKSSRKNQWINNIAWIGLGVGAGLVTCLLMGWIQLA